jgi:hypothetical protein
VEIILPVFFLAGKGEQVVVEFRVYRLAFEVSGC